MSGQFLTPEQASSIANATTRAIVRWITIGLKDGTIKLRAQKRGGRWFTTEAWINEFFGKCTGQGCGHDDRGDTNSMEVLKDGPSAKHIAAWSAEEQHQFAAAGLAEFGIFRSRDGGDGNLPDRKVRSASASKRPLSAMRRGEKAISGKTSGRDRRATRETQAAGSATVSTRPEEGNQGPGAHLVAGSSSQGL